MEKFELMFGILSGVTCLALVAFPILYLKLQRVTRDLVTVRQQMESRRPEPDEGAPRFGRNLLLAEVKQQLGSMPRPVLNTDRYRYVASLVKNGLDAGQIAEVLELGRGEAEQIVNLSLLIEKRRNQCLSDCASGIIPDQTPRLKECLA